MDSLTPCCSQRLIRRAGKLPYRIAVAQATDRKKLFFQNKINVKVTNYDKCSHEPACKVKPQASFSLAAAARQRFLTFVPHNSVEQKCLCGSLFILHL
jgi:hypothetical protein